MRLTVFEEETKKFLEKHHLATDPMVVGYTYAIGEAYSALRLNGWSGVIDCLAQWTFRPEDVQLSPEYSTQTEYVIALQTQLAIHFSFGIDPQAG